MNQQEVFNLIRQLTGQPNIIAVPRIFIDLLDGDYESAILLSQLLYWSDTTAMPEGWIAKTYNELQEEIGIPKKKAMRIIQKLKNMDIIETKVKKFNGNPTVHYSLKKDNLLQLLTQKMSMT